jgi:hypothetical protein
MRGTARSELPFLDVQNFLFSVAFYFFSVTKCWPLSGPFPLTATAICAGSSRPYTCAECQRSHRPAACGRHLTRASRCPRRRRPAWHLAHPRQLSRTTCHPRHRRKACSCRNGRSASTSTRGRICRSHARRRTSSGTKSNPSSAHLPLRRLPKRAQSLIRHSHFIRRWRSLSRA